MKPENWISLATAAATLALTALGLYLGPKYAVRRALEQFRSTKWWEKQQEAYNSLLEALSIIRYDTAADCEAIEMSESRTPGEFLKEKLRTANHNIQLYAAQGGYLISESAAEAVRVFEREYSRSVWQADHPYEAGGQILDAADKCIAVISREAKRVLLEESK